MGTKGAQPEKMTVGAMTEKRKTKKIRFGEYPYMVTRVGAMRSKLLKEEDYSRIMKMGINEITRFLAESEYKREIEELSQNFRGMELLELSVSKNLANTVNKLLHMSIQSEVDELINMYSKKWVFNNIKMTLRIKTNRLGPDNIRYSITPVEPTTYEYCLDLYQQESGPMINKISSLTGIDADTFTRHLRESDLAGLENEMDRALYTQFSEFSKRLRLGKKDPLKDFFQNMMNAINIKNIIFFRYKGIPIEKIKELVVHDSRDRLMESLVNAKNLNEIFLLLKKTIYKPLADEEVEKNITLLEERLDNFFLKYSFMISGKKLFSVSEIFGYLLEKEIEMRNLKLLIHSKGLGLDEKFIKDHLITRKAGM